MRGNIDVEGQIKKKIKSLVSYFDLTGNFLTETQELRAPGDVAEFLSMLDLAVGTLSLKLNL